MNIIVSFLILDNILMAKNVCFCNRIKLLLLYIPKTIPQLKKDKSKYFGNLKEVKFDNQKIKSRL